MTVVTPVTTTIRFVNLGEMMNLGGLDGSVSTLGGMVKLTGKAAGLARRAVYAVSFKGLSGLCCPA